MIHKANPDWGTHIPVLIKALRQTNGPVLELGLGISSTPLLHALCIDRKRDLFSYDNDPIFVEMFIRFKKNRHTVKLIKDWDDGRITEHFWSVVLIDHKPDARRKVEIVRLKDKALFLVVHDTHPEVNKIFGYDKIFSLFKYRYDYTKDRVHTTVLSNFRKFNV